MEKISEYFEIKSVIDIGVAEGTPQLYLVFPKQPYLLIEANPAFRNDMRKLEQILNCKTEMVLCGESEGEVTLQIFNDPRKSSAYNVRRKLETDQEISVPVKTLDSLVKKHGLEPPFLLKVDVEGAELDVLKGASETLSRCGCVILEASVYPKFKDGPDIGDLVCYMRDQGFKLIDILAGVNHKKTGLLYQADLVFARDYVLEKEE